MRRLGRVAAIGVLTGTLLGGCVTGGPGAGPRSMDCIDVPSGACTEQSDRLVSMLGVPVTSITLTCRVAGACTRAGGAGVAVLTLADGRTLTQTWSYAGDPNPVPVPVCIGIAFDLCREQVTSIIENVSPSHHLVSVTVTCRQRCDRSQGEVDIVFRSADGSTDQMGSGWSSAP